MMLVKGRYARVTKEGLKTTGLDGIITDFDLRYVTLKLIGSNIKSVRVRRENITIHETVLYRGVGNEIGTLLGDFFTPNMTKNSQGIGKTKFTPHFFRVDDECRFMHNSRVDQGKIVHIDIKEGKVTINHQGMLLTRKMNDIRLPASEPIFVKSSVSRPLGDKASLTVISYEMTIVKRSGEVKKVELSTKEKMQEYIDKLVNPDTVVSLSYRKIEKIYRPVVDVKPIVKTITKFEV